MNSINKKFGLLGAITIALGILILGVVSYTMWQVDQHESRQGLLRQYEQTIFELTILAQEYQFSRSERARQQWRTNFNQVQKLVEKLQVSYRDNEKTQSLMTSAARDLQLLGKVFDRLEKINENSRKRALTQQQQLTSSALYLSQQIAASSLQLGAIQSELWQGKFYQLAMLLILTVVSAKLVVGIMIFRLRNRTRESIKNFRLALDRLLRGEPAFEPDRDYLDEFGLVLKDFGEVSGVLRDRHRKLNDELAAYNQKLQEANTAKNRFLANMSHEIRTPLSIIDGYATLIAESGSHQSDHIEKIRWNIGYVLSLINEILDLSKVEADRMEKNIAPFELHELAPVLISLKRKAESKKIRFILKCPDPLPQVVATDKRKVEQLLMNIVGNALKFTDFGEVELSLFRREEFLVFQVKDSGQGIAPAQQEKLFSLFFQGYNHFHSEPGTGLGLVLSRKLARLLGGDVKLVESSPEMGSTFEVFLKVQWVDCAETITADDLLCFRENRGSLIKDLTGLDGIRILVVEDSPDLRGLMQIILEKVGASVRTAVHGKEVLEIISREPKAFDLILMDIQMPVLDGYGAVRRLRTMGYRRAVVACSARLMKEERERGLAAGFDDYLEKPVDLAQLVRLCRKLQIFSPTSGLEQSTLEVGQGQDRNPAPPGQISQVD